MRRESWWALVVLGVGGAYAGMRVLGTYWDFNAASSELPQAVRDYRAAGLPWTAADIDRHVAIKDNAAPLVRRALATMPGKSVDRAFDEAFPKGDADPTLYEPALALFHEAAKLPDLDFGRDWDLGASLTSSEPRMIRRVCEALSVRAERSAAKGDDAWALSDLEDVRRLSALMGKEPSMIGARYAALCEAIADRGAQACLVQTRDRLERLALYGRWLDVPITPINLRGALRGELYSIVAMGRNLDRTGVGGRFWPDSDFGCVYGRESEEDRLGQTFVPRREGLPENVRSRAYFARCLQMWTELAHRTRGLNDPLERVFAQAGEIGARYEGVKGLSHRLDPILFPVFVGFDRTNRLAQAARAVNRGFADALILHVRTGGWPTAVTVPDPLENGPLRVRFDGKRFRVWSVGPNGRDEGGRTRREADAMGKRSDDMVAACPPIPLKIPRTAPPPRMYNAD